MLFLAFSSESFEGDITFYYLKLFEDVEQMCAFYVKYLLAWCMVEVGKMRFFFLVKDISDKELLMINTSFLKHDVRKPASVFDSALFVAQLDVWWITIEEH